MAEVYQGIAQSDTLAVLLGHDPLYFTMWCIDQVTHMNDLNSRNNILRVLSHLYKVYHINKDDECH